MKALILVGGFGTRLRPLTLSYPKPLVEFCNEPIVVHQIKALVEVGVTEVILAVNYQPQVMMRTLESMERQYNIKITCSHETEPLGTAGPLALARDFLDDGDPFFVLNSDVICEYPLKNLLDFHNGHEGEGTIMVTRVDEPSKYGVVVTNERGKIEKFVEKPQEYIANKVNAGMYIFDRDILDRIQLRPTSIEREFFPQMAAEGNLYSMKLQGYWMDIGQPKDFIEGTCQHLDYLGRTNPSKLTTGSNFIGSVVVDSGAVIGKGCLIGPNVVIGPGCVIEDGVRLNRTTILPGVIVRANSWIHSSIIGWGSTIGRWCRIEGTTVIGEDVQVKDEKFINGGLILPHKAISTDIPEPGTIVM